MSVNLRSRHAKAAFSVYVVLGLLALSLSPRLFAQVTVATGSIQGKVVGPRREVIHGASVSVTRLETGSTIQTATNLEGLYGVSALLPGHYAVKASAKDLQPTELRLVVHVGVATLGNITLERGATPAPIQGAQIGVSRISAVQGVITSEQLRTLPVNGRLFLAPAQLEPGVQVVDAGGVEPNKVSFPSVSINGRFGRTTRVAVDGLDINDEVTGTIIQNVSQGATQEFQVSQSMPDLSTGTTSSGAVNVITRTGTKDWHGEGFYFFRDQTVNARLPGGADNPFQRNQFGGNVGGTLVRDKLFVFGDIERTKQDLIAQVTPSGPLESATGNYSAPLRETNGSGRLDWQIQPNNYHFFYRFAYDQIRDVTASLPTSFQAFASSNHIPTHTAGLDFTTGNYTHSIRGGYVRYHNQITSPGSAVPAIFAPGIELSIGSDPYCTTPGANTFCSGPSALQGRDAFQSNYQVRYDGSRVYGAHIFHFGGGYNRIAAGVIQPVLGNVPAVNAPTAACGPICQTLLGGAANPLNYPAVSVLLSNQLGSISEKSAFGLHGGGVGPDNQLSAYAGDSFRWKHNLTINYGVRYIRDTARTDSDLAPIPCPAGIPGCTGNVLNLLAPGFGDRVRQPNSNFAPQAGLAWDPNNSGKTVIRFGMGLFYDTSLLNNVLFDRAARLPSGSLASLQPACVNGQATPIVLPGTNTVVTPTFCGQSIGTAAAGITALQQQYAAAAASSSVNPAYYGNSLAAGPYATGTALIAPNFKTPRSFQLNAGLQHEMGGGVIFSLNYLRNVSTHDPLTVDVNHVGDARYVSNAASLAAIAATLASNPASVGCPAPTSVGQSSQAAVTCYLTHVPTASIADFARNGLDSGNVFCGGRPCSLVGRLAAFPGLNSSLGTTQMISTIGRSVYTAFQASIRQDMSHPIRGIGDLNWQFSYTRANYTSTGADDGATSFAEDNANTKFFTGPNALERRSQYSLGGTVRLPHSLQLGLLSHFYSPLPVTLRLPTTGQPGGIFTTDVVGDGTGDGSMVSNGGLGDILPGTNIGSLGRSISFSNLNTTITNYNDNFAGRLTPAGQALVNAGLVTPGQLISLGAVQPVLSQASAIGQPRPNWLKSIDLNLSWVHRVKDRVEIQPGVSVFNVANFANLDQAGNPLSGILDGFRGSANGFGNIQPAANRSGLGSGVFALGSPRQIEFFLKVSF